MKLLLPFSLLSLGFVACTSQPAPMSESQIQAKVDSAVAVQLPEITRQATEDRESRIAIEVKQKADSIVQARQAAAAQ